LQDFVWWSGLSATDARHGLALVDRDLETVSLEEKIYWRSNSAPKRPLSSTHLLPAYDEYNVAYKDRQLVLELSHAKPLITTWAMLGPTVMVDGRIVGIWKYTTDKKSGTIDVKLSRDLKKPERLAVASAVDRYATFLGLPATFGVQPLG
jgi:hypothetical protein